MIGGNWPLEETGSKYADRHYCLHTPHYASVLHVVHSIGVLVDLLPCMLVLDHTVNCFSTVTVVYSTGVEEGRPPPCLCLTVSPRLIASLHRQLRSQFVLTFHWAARQTMLWNFNIGLTCMLLTKKLESKIRAMFGSRWSRRVVKIWKVRYSETSGPSRSDTNVIKSATSEQQCWEKWTFEDEALSPPSPSVWR